MWRQLKAFGLQIGLLGLGRVACTYQSETTSDHHPESRGLKSCISTNSPPDKLSRSGVVLGTAPLFDQEPDEPGR